MQNNKEQLYPGSLEDALWTGFESSSCDTCDHHDHQHTHDVSHFLQHAGVEFEQGMDVFPELTCAFGSLEAVTAPKPWMPQPVLPPFASILPLPALATSLSSSQHNEKPLEEPGVKLEPAHKEEIPVQTAAPRKSQSPSRDSAKTPAPRRGNNLTEEDKPFLCPHDGCGLRYRYKGDLKVHFRTKHSVPAPAEGERPKGKAGKAFPCPVASCRSAYSYKRDLIRHFRKKHSGAPQELFQEIEAMEAHGAHKHESKNDKPLLDERPFLEGAAMDFVSDSGLSSPDSDGTHFDNDSLSSEHYDLLSLDLNAMDEIY